MIEVKKLCVRCGLAVVVIACLSFFVPWYNVSYDTYSGFPADPSTGVPITVTINYELTQGVVTTTDGFYMEASYSAMADRYSLFEELRNVMLFETRLVVAVAIIGAAISVASVFEKMRLLVPLGILAIVFSVAGLVYLVLAASGVDAELIGLSGDEVFHIAEGFWGTSNEAVFGPSVGWFMLIAVVVVLVCMIVFVLRERNPSQLPEDEWESLVIEESA